MGSRSLFAKLAAPALMVAAGAAPAHEVWIEPADYTLDVGEAIEVRLRNGEDFEGGSYPDLEEWFTRFDGGPFLINATMTKEPRGEGLLKGAIGERLWASPTYELPE